jgi:hypothetical protein
MQFVVWVQNSANVYLVTNLVKIPDLYQSNIMFHNFCFRQKKVKLSL